MRLLQIGEAARQLGITIEHLRRLEREGRIPKAKRLLNCRRVYTEDDLECIREILFAPATKRRS